MPDDGRRKLKKSKKVKGKGMDVGCSMHEVENLVSPLETCAERSRSRGGAAGVC